MKSFHPARHERYGQHALAAAHQASTIAKHIRLVKTVASVKNS